MNKWSAMRKRCAVLVVLLFSCLAAAHAEDTPVNQYEPVIYPGVRAGNGRTLGYMEYFHPWVQNEDGLLFINEKGVISSYSDSENNLGLGYRRLIDRGDRGFILGGNIFYDTRYTPSNHYVHQIGFGAELLTRYFDIRSNAYFALSDKRPIGSSTRYSFEGFKVVQTTTTIFEEPLSGLDVEVGVAVPVVSEFMETKVFGGHYFYDSKISDDVKGFRGRIEMKPAPNVTIQLEAKDNSDTDWEYFAGGYVTVPFDLGNPFNFRPFDIFKKSLGQPLRTLKERMTDPVIRDIDIQTTSGSQFTQTDVIPTVFHADASSAAGSGNGSVERPFHTIGEAVAATMTGRGDYIFVHSGTYTEVITLKANNVLWGAGYAAFPGLGTGSQPVIQDALASNVVTLANNVTIQGMTVKFGTKNIVGVGTANVTIRNSTISDYGTEGLDLSGASTNFLITDVIFSGFGGGNAFQALGTSGGILQNSTMSSTDGFAFGNLVTFNTSGAITIDNVVATDGGIGYALIGGGTYVFRNNTVSGLANIGLLPSASSLSGSNNTFSGNFLDCLDFGGNTGSIIYNGSSHCP